MEKVKELFVVVDNRPGAIGDLCGALSGAKINIVAIGVFQDVAKLFVSNMPKAIDVLTKKNYEIEIREVLKVEVDNKPGELAVLTNRLGNAGINIDYCYGTVADGLPSASIILDVSDIDSALEILRQ